MADLLTHVLVVYVVLTVTSWYVDGVTRRWIPVGMGGAAIPDLAKISILVDDATVQAVLGVPFEYGPIASLGGVVLIAGAITMAFDRQYWRRAYTVLVVGGVTSLLLDGFRTFADGRAGHWLYPVTWWRPPTPNLYVSSDPRVLGVTLVVAGFVFVIDRFRNRRNETA